jgi:hypothetical protein
MWRKAVGASIVAMLLIFSGLGLGQQLNPFTAILSTNITRQPVKVGRNRIAISNVSSVTSSEQKNSSRTSTESARRNDHKKSSKSHIAKTEKEKRPAVDTAASASQPDTGAVTLSPVEDPLDLRRQIGIKYQILSEKNGELHPDDPNRIYHSGESFRIKIESNVNANLYLISEDSRTGERHLLFPNYKFQRGAERVKPLTPVVVPPLGQPAFTLDNMPGEERIVLICSRDEIPALQLAPEQSMPDAVKLVASRDVPSDIEQNITRQEKLGARDFVWVSQEQPTAQKKKGAGVYVVNTSKKDNEEVVYVIRLKHGD